MNNFHFQANPLRRLIIPVIILLAIVIAGVIGYNRLEAWPLIDSLYMVVITLSTVGFREVHDLSQWGRILTMGIIVTGVSTAIYAAGQIIEITVEGQIIGYRRRKKMEKRIKEMKNHYIICGFGRVGHQVAMEFKAAKVPFVVIDNKQEVSLDLEPKGIPYLIGDITSDATLKEAGILHAKGLIASADSDTANVFVTLSARVLNPGLFIIARAGYLDSEEKLKKAGANRVISPYFTAGKHMAEIAVEHHV
jgi:voltage-gated potassium channel